MRMRRREFLGGTAAPFTDMHISSLVVHCRPGDVDSVKRQIEAMPEAAVPKYSDEGKLVVLLETTSEHRIMQCMSAIEDVPGVISTALVYHQIDSHTGDTP